MSIEAHEVFEQTKQALQELFSAERSGLRPVRTLAVGCSSSEIAGGTIGHASAYDLGEAVAEAALEVCRARGIQPLFQCCEHLNRALIVERAFAEERDLEIVSVVPQPKAGGSLATAAWRHMLDPVAVLSAQADAGIDIGLTLIGMHLKRVAVPVRLKTDRIGQAVVVAARTRPLLVGGERAVYCE